MQDRCVLLQTWNETLFASTKNVPRRRTLIFGKPSSSSVENYAWERFESRNAISISIQRGPIILLSLFIPANKKMRYTAVWSQHTPQAIDSFQPKCLQIPGSKVQNSQLVLVHLAPLKLCAIYTFPKAGQLGYERRPLRSCHLTILNLDFPSNTTTFCISVGEESINV